MAKYYSNTPAYINGQFINASVQQPLVFELPDDVEPSRAFEPLDDAAVAAFSKMEVEKEIRKDLDGQPLETPIGEIAELRSAVPRGSVAKVVMSGTTQTITEGTTEQALAGEEKTTAPTPDVPTEENTNPDQTTMTDEHRRKKGKRPSDQSPVE